MGYRALGFVVWHGAKWFLRRKYGAYVPSRPVAAAGLVGVGVAVLVVKGLRDDAASGG